MSRERGGVRGEPPRPFDELGAGSNPLPRRGQGAGDRSDDPRRGDLVTATVCVLAVVAATVIGAVLIAATLRPGLEPPPGVLGMLGALLTGPLVLVRQREKGE